MFEVRQGYKSKDSKRQNADLANASTAYQQGYLPVVTILSSQIDNDVAVRYVEAGWVLLRGTLDPSPFVSTFAFCRDVLGYDLAGFFARHANEFRAAVDDVLNALLSAEDIGTEPMDNPQEELTQEDSDELDQ